MGTIRPKPYLKKPEDMSYTSWQHEKWSIMQPYYNDILNATKAELEAALAGGTISEADYKGEINLGHIYANMDLTQLEVYAAMNEAAAQVEIKRRNGEMER